MGVGILIISKTLIYSNLLNFIIIYVNIKFEEACTELAKGPVSKTGGQ